ncbi:hypothetical protein HBH61_123160 [Parastagonospora nodorum]|nr:hypothetical protein HBH61_123160 [Parastagonospora nodorum]KAH4848084.1 hypothetical protein HBH75_156680 [Parastagonospora nodorum]
MARTKSIPKRAPDFAPTINTEILHRAANNPNQPYEPLQPARLGEVQIQPEWTSAMIAQAQAAKKDQDLRKAQDFITVAIVDRSAVSNSDVKWAMNIGCLLKAEVVGGALGVPAVQNQAVRAPLTRENLAAFLGEDWESDKLSDLEEFSALNPEREQEILKGGVVVFCMALYLRHMQGAETT